MAINAGLSDFTPGQRTVSYVPMPFEEMYAAMMEKQKRYDVADQYERETKREISKLKSPIAAHNEYLEKNVKQKFINDAMLLHKSMPDKGSADYKRRLNDLIDGVVSDPNLSLIEQSSGEYDKFLKVSTELMAKGLYSNAAAKPYKDFTGANPDGTLTKFQFMGLRPKKDVDAIVNDVVAKTPMNKTSSSVTTIGGKVTASSLQTKDWKTIYSGLKNRVLNDPELLSDAMEQYNAKDQNELLKIFEIKAKDEAIKNSETVNGWDSGLLNRQDNLRREAEEKAAAEAAAQVGSYKFGDYSDNYNNQVLSEVSAYLDEKGNIKPTISDGGIYPSMGSPLTMGTGSYVGKTTPGLTSTSSAKERMEYSKKKLLANPKFKAMVDNYMYAGLSQDDAIKKAGQELKAMPFGQKRLEGRMITSTDEQKALLPTLKGMAGTLSFYDADNPTGSKVKKISEVLKETDGDLDDLYIGGELAPVAGLSGDQNYFVTLGKGDKTKSYIISMDSPYGNRKQSKMLFEAQRTKTPLRLNKYYPEIDNNTENETLRQDASTYGTENVIIYTGTDGKLHLKRAK